MAIYVRNKEGVMESYKIVGLKGENGVTPNIQIGTVTTLEAGEKATVTREGTKENPIFNFGIPKGADGTGGSGTDGASIDDSTISKNKTWSSSKIEDFVLTNNNTIWKDVNGENLSIEHIKEGFLREVEILGNTVQNQENLEDIQHLGELYVDDDGKPKLDSQGRKQYKIEVESFNGNLGEYELEVGALNYNTGLNIDDNTKFRTKDFIKLDNWLIDSYQNITNSYGYNNYYTYVFYNKEKKYIAWKILNQLKKTDIPTGAEYFKFFTLYREGVLDEKTFQSNVWYSKKPKESYCESKRHKTTILTPCQLSKVDGVSDRLYWDSSKGRYVVEKKVYETTENDMQNITTKIIANIGDNDLFAINKFEPFVYKGKKFLSTDVNLKKDSSYIHANGNLEYYLPKGLVELNVVALRNYLTTNNIKMYIPLSPTATPQLIETNITKELKLPTYINNTYISVSGGIDGGIKAKAPVDGGKVIKTLQRENIELKATNDKQDELINVIMLATDEMFMILEPLLPEAIDLNERSTSNMADMYIAMVQRGIKTIDEVPARYREQVKQTLEQLEK